MWVDRGWKFFTCGNETVRRGLKEWAKGVQQLYNVKSRKRPGCTLELRNYFHRMNLLFMNRFALAHIIEFL